MVRVTFIALALCLVDTLALGQSTDPQASGVLTLRNAVDLALKHNHIIRLAAAKVDETEQAKSVAKSAYFPSVRSDTNLAHVTDTQLIEIPAGGLGALGTSLVPPQSLILNQGGQSFATSGVGLIQPLTQLLKIRAANDVASADVRVARASARKVENDIALKVHQIYYKILIAEARRGAVVRKIEAAEDLQRERVQQVTYGSALNAELIESRAQSLQARQELLTTDLQLSDLRMQFNDTIGRPVSTAVLLDANAAPAPGSCEREECVRLALDAHPEIAEARATVEKAQSGLRLAQYAFVPDVEAYARYSFQNNTPFLAGNFGTIGVHLTYELFDGGRRRAAVRERAAQLSQANENLQRVRDDVELRVHTAYNKLERTREMVSVSQELLTLREESRRVAAEQLAHGAALRSQAAVSVSQEFEAKAVLLQSRLDYVQAVDELNEATGQIPR